MIRILGGELRGRKLRVPARATRPSSARLREALFSSIGPWLSGSIVFDLFAGCGALGIEALSRGAARATFVEIDDTVIRVLRANLEALGLGPERAHVRRGDARRWLARLEREDSGERPALCLLDPPYGPDVALPLLPVGLRLVESRRLAVFALEHASDTKLPDLSGASGVTVRTRRHGGGAFTVLERVDE